MQEPVETSEIIRCLDSGLARERRKSHYGKARHTPGMSKSGTRRGPLEQSVLIAKGRIPTYTEHLPVPFTLPFQSCSIVFWLVRTHSLHPCRQLESSVTSTRKETGRRGRRQGERRGTGCNETRWGPWRHWQLTMSGVEELPKGRRLDDPTQKIWSLVQRTVFRSQALSDADVSKTFGVGHI